MPIALGVARRGAVWSRGFTAPISALPSGGSSAPLLADRPRRMHSARRLPLIVADEAMDRALALQSGKSLGLRRRQRTGRELLAGIVTMAIIRPTMANGLPQAAAVGPRVMTRNPMDESLPDCCREALENQQNRKISALIVVRRGRARRRARACAATLLRARGSPKAWFQAVVREQAGEIRTHGLR